MLDHDACYRAVRSRDARFDGVFFTAVTSTGIYCRPSCPALTPKREHTVFHPTAAAAQQAGFRACRRCRPDATPGSPEWNVRADAVGRAMRLIADGVVDRDGVSGLAARLGYSERQVHRQLVAEVGAGPLALARAQRTQTARILIETTTLPMAQVAFAAGFDSIRQFNDTLRAIFATTPSRLRAGSGADRTRSAPGSVRLRLAYRPPLDGAFLLRFLADRAVRGVEEVDGRTYRRVLSLPHGTGVAELELPDDGVDTRHVSCLLRLDDLRDLTAAVHRCRRVLDLDADPTAVHEALATDPALRPALRTGRRVPGAVSGDELAVRALLGQQVSVAAARTTAGRLVSRYGKPLTAPAGALTHEFPTADALADAAELAMPATRAGTVRRLAAAAADGVLRLDGGEDRDAVTAALLAIPGVGPWTAGYIRMRALADPDVFLGTDLGVRRALRRLGLPDAAADADRYAARWRPWRSYAVLSLWATETRSS